MQGAPGGQGEESPRARPADQAGASAENPTACLRPPQTPGFSFPHPGTEGPQSDQHVPGPTACCPRGRRRPAEEWVPGGGGAGAPGAPSVSLPGRWGGGLIPGSRDQYRRYLAAVKTWDACLRERFVCKRHKFRRGGWEGRQNNSERHLLAKAPTSPSGPRDKQLLKNSTFRRPVGDQSPLLSGSRRLRGLPLQLRHSSLGRVQRTP